MGRKRSGRSKCSKEEQRGQTGAKRGTIRSMGYNMERRGKQNGVREGAKVSEGEQ